MTITQTPPPQDDPVAVRRRARVEGQPAAGNSERPGGRRRKTPTMAAGRVLIVIVVALATAMLLDSRGMVHTGEAMPPGGGRDFVLGVAHPIDSFAHELRLDWPHERFDKLLGRDQYTGARRI